MSDTGIIRFEPHGPIGGGLKPWFAIDPADLAAGEPVQRVHIYDQDETAGYLTGVWDCTAMTDHFGPYPVHEVMVLLEGSLEFKLSDGSSLDIETGQPFFIPKGLPCQWIQTGYVRKFFLIFENPGAEPEADVTSQGIIRPPLSGDIGGSGKLPAGNGSGYVGDPPVRHAHVDFRDPSGQLTVTTWDATKCQTVASAATANELILVEQGSLTLTDDAGAEHHLNKGEAAFIRQRATHAMKVPEFVRALSTRYTPSA